VSSSLQHTLARLDGKHVTTSLRRLAAAKADVFGVIGHHFVLNPPLTEAEVVAFEQGHQVRLPPDYRHFLTSIGNGGAGPYYGVFPLGKWFGAGSKLEVWHEGEGVIGVLSKPFPLTDTWNDLSGMPSSKLQQTDEQEYERQYDEFEKRYWDSSLVNGAIPICEIGCALRIWLVLTGALAGHLWRDGRADNTGLTPLRVTDGSMATFSVWYVEWLEDAIESAFR
jgi:hypothetical protein